MSSIDDFGFTILDLRFSVEGTVDYITLPSALNRKSKIVNPKSL